MKLSDVKGERTFDVIADIIDPVANIALDETAAEMFKRGDKPDGEDARTFALARFRKCMPVLMREHKRDIMAIMAAIEGVDVDEYAETLTLSKLALDVLELVNDEEFAAFLS